MTLGRSELETCRSALRLAREVVGYRHEPTQAFEHALVAIESELTSGIAASGSQKQTTRDTGWVNIATAARALSCSQRRMRDIAPSIGGIKSGRDWLIPRDSLPEDMESHQ